MHLDTYALGTPEQLEQVAAGLAEFLYEGLGL